MVGEGRILGWIFLGGTHPKQPAEKIGHSANSCEIRPEAFVDMGDCQNDGLSLDPYYNTAPNM